MALLEAHLRLNYVSTKLIEEIFKNNGFDDVETIKNHVSTNTWCTTCMAG